MSGEQRLRSATAADASALADLWASAFMPPLAPDQWLVDEERFAHTIVAEDGAGLCGSIYGLPKRLRESGGRVADVHCIGSVAVAARARGEGLARRLVAATLDGARGADWALLFTGTPDVYRSSGFEGFTMQRTIAGPWGASPAEVGRGLQVSRETVSPGALGRLSEVYEGSREGRVSLAPVRSTRDWAMAEVRLAGGQLYLLAEGAQIVGYAIARIDGDTGVILEMAALPAADSIGVHRELLSAVAADWAAAGVIACDIAVPRGEGVDHIFRVFAPEAVRQDDRTGMIRPLRRAQRLHGVRHLTEADYF